MNTVDVNWVDYGILIVIGLSVVVSLWRGFIREVMSLFIWVTAFFAAAYFFVPLSELLFSSVTIIVLRLTISFLIIFLSLLIAGGILSHFVGRLIKFTGLGTTDRIIGLLFGFCRGALVIAVAVMVFKPTPLSKDKFWQQSTLIPHFQPLAEPLAVWLGDFTIWVRDQVPEDLLKKMQINI